jgi:UDP-3-O-[3-hydroxymyristoyl] glucosamine N-acyltransferase
MLGKGVIANEIMGWLQYAKIPNVTQIDHDAFYSLDPCSQCLLGFSDLDLRARWTQELQPLDLHWCTYAHPTAVIHPQARIGPGCAICPRSVIGWNVDLADFVYVGDSGLIGHNTSVDQNVFFGPGCVVGGSCRIGSHCFFGLGSHLRDHLTITANTNFCMSSVISKDITQPGQYYHNRLIKP